MAVVAYNITTAKTDVNTVWRKVQGPLVVGAQFMVPEYDMLDDLQDFDVDWSAREITWPVDLVDDVGIASIPEGGYEARPSSPKPVDASVTWILLNGRITISKTARWIDEKNKAAMLERQLLYQGKKKLQAVARRIGEYTYGFSTGTMAKVVSVSGSDVLLKDMYGIVGLGSTTSPYAILKPFKVGEFVAGYSGATLRVVASVTANPGGGTQPSITLSAVTGLVANDILCFANSVQDADLNQTDKNNALIGLLDGSTSASVHGISNATQANWDVAFSDTTGGRFTGTRLHKARHAIGNLGVNEPDTMIWSQGVERDVIAGLQGAVRFTDPFGMEMDGSPKAKGLKIFSSRFVPEGFTWVFAKKSLNKMTLLPKPGTPAWNDAYKLQDLSGFVFPLDYPCALVWKVRRDFAYWQALAEA